MPTVSTWKNEFGMAGRVFSKTVWLPREECEKILANDLDWMAERESVIFDLYYHITHEGYRMVSMDEGREQIISEEGNGQITILEKEKRQLLPGKEAFFLEKPEWVRTLHPENVGCSGERNVCFRRLRWKCCV